MYKITLKDFKDVLALEIARGKEALTSFKEELSTNPGSALSWSQSVFERVALMMEAEYILRALETGKLDVFEKVGDYLTKEVLTKAKFPTRSTSVTTGLYDEYALAAKAYLLSRLNGEF